MSGGGDGVCVYVYTHVAETGRVVTPMSAAVGLGVCVCAASAPPPTVAPVAEWLGLAGQSPQSLGVVWVGGQKQERALAPSPVATAGPVAEGWGPGLCPGCW